MKKISRLLAKLKAKVDFKKRFMNWRTMGGLYFLLAVVLLFMNSGLLKIMLIMGAVIYGMNLTFSKK